MPEKGSSAVASWAAPGPHHRRVRTPRKLRRRSPTTVPYTILGVGAAILIGVTGFTLGSLVIGSFSSTSQQTAAYGVPSAPPGISWVSAEAQLVTPTSVPETGSCTTSNLGTALAPTALVNGAATAICLSTSAGGFATSDLVFALNISWNTSAAVNTTFKVQIAIDVTPTANDVLVTSYVKTSTTITTSEEAVFALDISQSTDTSVTEFSALVTQL